MRNATKTIMNTELKKDHDEDVYCMNLSRLIFFSFSIINSCLFHLSFLSLNYLIIFLLLCVLVRALKMKPREIKVDWFPVIYTHLILRTTSAFSSHSCFVIFKDLWYVSKDPSKLPPIHGANFLCCVNPGSLLKKYTVKKQQSKLKIAYRYVVVGTTRTN